MTYRFQLTSRNAILNFSEEYAATPLALILSEGFTKILKAFIWHEKERGSDTYLYLTACQPDDDALIRDLKDIARLLLIMDGDEIGETYGQYAPYFLDRVAMYHIIEKFYLFWRRYQRYAVLFNDHKHQGLGSASFLDAINHFETLVLETYRTIEQRAVGHQNKVYRQIAAGVNAGISVSVMRSTLPYEYRALDDIPFIENVVIRPPLITYSKRNKRDGVFREVTANPLEDKKFAGDEWFCYPAKVGDLLAYIYFHVDYMAHGITLCNLFELADEHEYRSRQPDLIYVFGYDDQQENQCFYQDDANHLMVGYLSLSENFDYFGYMKKMILTLYNVNKINHQKLPVHGAMIALTLRDGRHKNIVIMGDSGAGKSETLEQLKAQGRDMIRDMKTVYDDMGVLSLAEDGRVVSSGTETGAFVRLDDLDAGYGYKELDRSVFMNPDKVNARIIIPVTDYRDVITSYPVDYFLYANNYDKEGEALTFFSDVDEALAVFRRGARQAKGTTTETGLVESYFANPFGPVQRQKQCEDLLQKYFQAMFNQRFAVGMLRTRLAVSGQAHSGPKECASALLKLISA